MYRQMNNLLKLSQAGCREAKGELLYKLKPLILSSIKKYYNKWDEYDDLIQEGYEVVLKSLTSYDPHKGTRFLGYIKLQLRYHYLNKHREKEHLSLNQPIDDGKIEILDLIESNDINLLDSLIAKENMHEIVEALNSLTERQKQIITEFYINELTLGEIAEKLNISYRTVANTKTRGLKKLRDTLVK